MQRSEDGCDMRRFRRFNHSTCKTVLNLLEAVYLDGYSGVVGYESFFIAIQFGLLSALFCCTRAVHYTQSVNQSNIASLRTADRHMCSLYGGTQRLSPQKLTPLFPHKPINSQALGGKVECVSGERLNIWGGGRCVPP